MDVGRESPEGLNGQMTLPLHISEQNGAIEFEMERNYQGVVESQRLQHRQTEIRREWWTDGDDFIVLLTFVGKGEDNSWLKPV